MEIWFSLRFFFKAEVPVFKIRLSKSNELLKNKNFYRFNLNKNHFYFFIRTDTD